MTVSAVSADVDETDAEGRAELLFPADGKVDWVLALKDGVGFDYYENFLAFPTLERETLPDKVSLKLDGARPDILAEAKTPDDKAVAGALVMPWTIKKPGKLAYANVSGSRITRRMTDEQGQAHFAFLPATSHEGASFLVYSETYHSTEGLFIAAGGAGPLQHYAEAQRHDPRPAHACRWFAGGADSVAGRRERIAPLFSRFCGPMKRATIRSTSMRIKPTRSTSSTMIGRRPAMRAKR